MPPAGTEPAPRRETLPFAPVLAAIALVALGIRIGFIVWVAPQVPKLGDASAYHLLAENLARGRGYIRPFDDLLLHLHRPTAEYPPLFPALLSLPARLGAHSVEQQRIFLAFVGAGTVALVGLLGRRVASNAVGLTAAALAAVYPMLFLSEATLMAESLYVGLVTLLLLCAYRAYDDPKPARFVVLGVAIGLATLTRAEGILLGLVIVVPLCWWLRDFTTRQRAARAGVALGVAIVVIAPWTIRNAIQFHAFVPVSNNVATLIDGANCDATYGGAQLGLWRESFSSLSVGGPAYYQALNCFTGFEITAPHFDEAKAANADTRAGLSYARHHLGSVPKVAVVRVLRTWGLYAPTQQVNFESLEGRPRAWQLRGTQMYWVLAPLAIAGAVLVRRRRRVLWPLLATAVTVTIVAATTYGQQRFRIAAEPAILVLAAATIVEAINAADRRLRPAAVDVLRARRPLRAHLLREVDERHVTGVGRREPLQDSVQARVALVVYRVARVDDSLRVVGRGRGLREHDHLGAGRGEARQLVVHAAQHLGVTGRGSRHQRVAAHRHVGLLPDAHPHHDVGPQLEDRGRDHFVDHCGAAVGVRCDLLVAGGGDLAAGDATAEHRGLPDGRADTVADRLQARVEAARGGVADDQDAQPGRGVTDLGRPEGLRFLGGLGRLVGAR
jgi:4-amino-4-deoxy-L-arabinose transferase-like glycosyltransferase